MADFSRLGSQKGGDGAAGGAVGVWSPNPFSYVGGDGGDEGDGEDEGDGRQNFYSPLPVPCSLFPVPCYS
ncbi:MAG: hypothetical protein RIB93_26380 [Coleofasciculus sp. D1-CHI-01]|uniref:hypothetical protein n=1 Tax=Coleofasciculus sp. D1-CHI-01 TaxID=3068482 RepID=UPI0032FED17E